MTTTNQVGFTEAHLKTQEVWANVYARSDTDYSFEVSIGGGGDYTASQFFHEEDLREAAEFFIKLADELKRREGEE